MTGILACRPLLFFQKSLDAPEGSSGAVFQLVFPDAEDGPAFLAEEFFGGAVAGDVALDFFEPVFLVGGGHAAVLRAAVPEAAVDENGEALFGEDEVRPAGDGDVAAPAFDVRGAEEREEVEFGGFVSTGTNCGHDAGAFGFGEGVGHGMSMRRFYDVGECLAALRFALIDGVGAVCSVAEWNGGSR